ncbi:MAG: hypothetical protein K6G81_07670 [Lachnospiraceae bacterium]|nr:hypothetical protein [Lachnospiraceae bacterium]
MAKLKKWVIVPIVMLLVTLFAGTAFHAYAAETASSGSSTEVTGKILNITYDPWGDYIEIETDKENVTVWYADVKKEEGASLDSKKFKSSKSVLSKSAADKARYFTGFSLNDKSEGFKIGENKNAYLYISTDKPASGKETYTPTYTVYAAPKLSKVELDYCLASKSDKVYEPAVLSFAVKDSEGTTTYSKYGDYNAYLNMLSKLVFGMTETAKDDPWAEESVYDKDTRYLKVDEAASTAKGHLYFRYSKPGANGALFAGKLIFQPTIDYDAQSQSGASGNSGEGLTSSSSGSSTNTHGATLYPDRAGWVKDENNWVFVYDQTEENRLYRYEFELDLDDSEMNQEGIKGYLTNNFCLDSLYYYKASTTDSAWLFKIYDHYYSNLFAQTCKPAQKYDLDGACFKYFEEDAESERDAGFYRVGNDGKPVTPLDKLETYGVTVSCIEDSSLVGLSVSITELEDAEIAPDFGIHPEIYREDAIENTKIGDYYLIREYPYFGLERGRLWEDVEGATEAKLDKDSGTKLKYTYYFKLIGGEKEAGKSANRSSKLVKTSLKAASNAIQPKFNLKNESYSIKNGFDFSLDWGETWYTILPCKAGGTAASPIISTDDYVAVKKVEDKPEMFTTEKVTSLTLKELEEKYGSYTLFYRKSAKVGAPASHFSDEECLEICDSARPMPEADKSDPALLGKADAKGTIKLLKIDGADSKDVFEYLIVSAEDFKKEHADPGYIDVNSSKWSKYKAGGKIKIEGAKSKYKLKDGSEVEHSLADGSYILIRQKGAKHSEGSVKEKYVWYSLNSDYYVASLGTVTADDKTTPALVSEMVRVIVHVTPPASVSSRYSSDEIYSLVDTTPVIVRGDTLFTALQQSSYTILIRAIEDKGGSLLGWSDTEDYWNEAGDPVPNISIDTVLDKAGEMHVYAVFSERKAVSGSSGSGTGGDENTQP